MHHTSVAFDSPKLALFWFVADEPPSSRLVSVRWAVEHDGDSRLKCPPYEHPNAWLDVVALDRSLEGYSYAFYPRGRLEYLPPTRRWVMSIDRQLVRDEFIEYLVELWRLPKGHVTVVADLAYRSGTALRGPDFQPSSHFVVDR